MVCQMLFSESRSPKRPATAEEFLSANLRVKVAGAVQTMWIRVHDVDHGLCLNCSVKFALLRSQILFD